MRAGAIRDEECVGRIVHQLRFDNLAVRQIDRARHMALREQGWTPHVEQDKAGRATCERAGDVGAISFELKRSAEVGECGGGAAAGMAVTALVVDILIKPEWIVG